MRSNRTRDTRVSQEPGKQKTERRLRGTPQRERIAHASDEPSYRVELFAVILGALRLETASGIGLNKCIGGCNNEDAGVVPA